MELVLMDSSFSHRLVAVCVASPQLYVRWIGDAHRPTASLLCVVEAFPGGAHR